MCFSFEVAERVAAERAESVGNRNSCGYQIRLQRYERVFVALQEAKLLFCCSHSQVELLKDAKKGLFCA